MERYRLLGYYISLLVSSGILRDGRTQGHLGHVNPHVFVLKLLHCQYYLLLLLGQILCFSILAVYVIVVWSWAQVLG